jgi:rhodanese-related sulfurtransferase
MKKTSVVATVLLAFAVGLALPASSADWVDQHILSVSEKVLATMPADFHQVEPKAAQDQIQNAKPFLLDVREAKEMAKGKIAGAVHIPIRDLPKMVAKLPASKSAPILTYCQVGYRGGMSVTLLRMWGYTNVRTIKGGLDAWEKAGLPVVEKTAS